MRRRTSLFLLATAVASVAAGLFLCWPQRPPQAPEEAPADDPVGVAAHASELRGGAAAREPEPPGDPGKRAVVQDATRAVVTGRCVEGGGAAVGGARVHLQGVRGGQAAAIAAADGTFAVVGDPAPPVEVQLYAASDVHLETRVECGKLAAGRTYELGDVVLVAGCVVRGCVRDARGKPTVGLVVFAAPAGDAWKVTPRGASALTGADGTFALQPVLAAGRWLLRADPREFTEAALFTAPAGPAAIDLQLVLADRREPAVIAGRVLDVEGHPVSGVDVTVRDHPGVEPATSGRDGSFRLLGWDANVSAPVAVVPTDGGPEEPPQTVPWGRKDVELRWTRGTDVEVQVRQAADGAPIGDVSVILDGSAPARRTDATGVAVFPELPASTVVVRTDDPRWSDGGVLRVAVGGAPTRHVELSVVPVVERKLTVVDAAGRPVPNALVYLWRSESDPGAPAVIGAAGRQGPLSALSQRHRKPLSNGQTSAGGQCQVRAPAGVPALLFIDPQGQATFVRRDVDVAAMPQPWIERLPAGAVITGRIDPRLVPARTMIGAEPADDATALLTMRQHMDRVREDGSFRLTGLGAGSWRLVLYQPRMFGLADVPDLREGETRTVVVEPSALRTATVAGTVRWNGRPVTGGVRLVRLDLPEGAGAFSQDWIVTDERGEFRVTLAPGRCRAALPHGTGGIGMLPFEDELVLAPGSHVHCDLHLRSRAVRVRAMRGARPVAGVSVQAVVAGRFDLTFAPTDDYGCAEFALPLGVHPLFALSRRDPGGKVSLGGVYVVAGEGPQVVVLDLPPGAGR